MRNTQGTKAGNNCLKNTARYKGGAFALFMASGPAFLCFEMMLCSRNVGYQSPSAVQHPRSQGELKYALKDSETQPKT